MKKHLKKGFTLIELLVVVAIIAILALIVLLALNPVEMARRSRDSQRLSDLGTLRRAIDLALADKQSMGDTGGSWVNLTGTNASVTNFAGMSLNLDKYLSVVPIDPVYVSGDNTTVQIVTQTCDSGTETKNNMVYSINSDGNVYVLRARLESTESCSAINRDGLEDDYYETGTAPGLSI